MVSLGYGILIAQNYSFLRGIEIDPRSIPNFDHALAEKTVSYI